MPVPLLAMNPRNPTILYASGSYEDCYWVDWCGVCSGFLDLFKSTDGGSNWGSAGGGANGRLVFGLAIDPVNSNTLYAGTDAGMFKSTDAGGSWSVIAATLSPASSFGSALNPTNLNVGDVYLGPDCLQEHRWGGRWTRITNAVVASDIRALIVDPITPTTLYAASYSGVFKSVDSDLRLDGSDNEDGRSQFGDQPVNPNHPVRGDHR